jgi:fumarylacetoacetate (FAA) hydrolase family protein
MSEQEEHNIREDMLDQIGEDLNYVNIREDNSMENSHTFLNPGLNTRPNRNLRRI